MNIYIFLAILSFSAISLKGATPASNDSVPSTPLEEVVVIGEKQWMTDGKAVFIPSKQARHLAKDMEQMIEIINTPLLSVNNGEISTSSGEPVSLFINGMQVDKIDKSTFWANDVVRVEFYPYTSDPEFLGHKNVVNFIIKEYVAGGLTRMEGDQWLPNEGDYAFSSKLVYKKMTYNVTARAGYSRDHFAHTDIDEAFDDVWYNGSFYDLIHRIEKGSAVSRNNYFSTAANARYRTNKIYAAHGIAFHWNQNPNSGETGSGSYNPAILPSGLLNTHSQSRSSSVRINGDYSSQMSKKLILGVNWYAGYNHNNNYSRYVEYGATSIDNYTHENVLEVNLKLRLAYLLSQKIALQFSAQNGYQYFRANYQGSANSTQYMSLNQTTLSVGGSFNLPSIQFGIYPQIAIFNRHINAPFKQTDFLPGVSATASYQPHRRTALNLDVSYSNTSPTSKYINDLIVRQTELKWIEGNPAIKPSDFFGANLNLNWMPLSWFSMSASLRDQVYTNDYAVFYRSGGIDYIGIIGQYINGLTFNTLYTAASFSFRPFSGALQLQSTLIYKHQSVKGVQSLHQFQPKFSASWYFSDFSIGIFCQAPEKSLKNGGTNILKTDWSYDLSLSYGNGRLMCDVEFNNIFNKYLLNKTTTDNGPFHSHRLDWSRGRNVKLSLTYYFDYGKKVSPSIDIQNLEIGNSSILGAN